MRLVPDYGNPHDPPVRAKYAYLEAGVSIVGNLLIAFLKLFVGFLIGSFSIIADAVHTLSDVGTSIVVIAGITAATKEPDAEHPFGHGRYEYVAALIISISLFIVGARFILVSAGKFLNPDSIAISGNELAVYSILIATMLGKEAMARYGFLIGRKIESKMVEADAWHHRADSLTTVGVIAAIFMVQMGYPIADPLLGAGISVYIMVEAFKLARSSINLIMGTSGDAKVRDSIEEATRKIEGVDDVHHLYIHDYGTRRLVSMHIVTPCDTSTVESHAIATKVENIVEDMVHGAEALIHVEPGGGECGRDMERALVSVLKKTPEIVSYHSVRIAVDAQGPHITVHATVNNEMSVEDSHKLVHIIDQSVKEICPGCRVDIHVEPCEKECFDCGVCEKG